MKTTVDIADPLLAEAKRQAAEDAITLRELVEEGLRAVLAAARAALLRLAEQRSPWAIFWPNIHEFLARRTDRGALYGSRHPRTDDGRPRLQSIS